MTKSQVDKAGRILTKAGESPGVTNVAIDLIGQWRALHNIPLDNFHMAASYAGLLLNITNAIVVKRLKRMESIRAKLLRSSSRLCTMQDIAGCRAVLFALADVERLVDCINSQASGHYLKREDNYILHPPSSGYRGIHLIYEYDGGEDECRGLCVELQVRTWMQHIWATAVEIVGLFTKQNLKAGEGDADWLRFFALLGGYLALLEETPLAPGMPNAVELIRELKGLIISLDVPKRLILYSSTINISGTDIDFVSTSDRRYYLLSLYLEEGRLQMDAFDESDLERANAKYVEMEKRISAGEKIDAVLVSAKSVDELRMAYPNYYGLTDALISALERILVLPAN